jgi:hypothetical protein
MPELFVVCRNPGKTNGPVSINALQGSGPIVQKSGQKNAPYNFFLKQALYGAYI